MRVLHLISSSGLFGAERVVIELSKGLQMIGGCQPIIGIINNSYNSHVELKDEALSSKIRSVIFDCKSQYDRKTILSIRKFIKDNAVDIVHSHGYKSNIYALLATRRKIPLVTTNHNWLKSHWRLKIYSLVDALLIRYFDKIVAVSDGVKNEMIGYSIPAEKIEVIDNGIDLDRFNNLNDKSILIKNELGISENDKVVGTIGSLGHEKGHIYLLRAAKEIIKTNKAVKFIIVGDGPLRKDLENEKKLLGINSNVVCTGYRRDIPCLLSVIDIFVLPSIIEGLPMVILEAMASKKPVVASDVGAVPKVIKDGENGLLCQPGNVDHLQKAISILLEDEKKAVKLANSGYMTVKSKYSSNAMSLNYLTIYNGLLNQADLFDKP